MHIKNKAFSNDLNISGQIIIVFKSYVAHIFIKLYVLTKIIL